MLYEWYVVSAGGHDDPVSSCSSQIRTHSGGVKGRVDVFCPRIRKAVWCIEVQRTLLQKGICVLLLITGQHTLVHI